MTLAECVERFVPADCCLSPVLTLDEAVASEQVATRQLVRQGPDGALQALFPAWVDGEPPALRELLRATDAGFDAAGFGEAKNSNESVAA